MLADITNLNDVLTKLRPQFSTNEWMGFGLECGLHHCTLKKIQADNPKDTEGCFTECVACWLKRKDDVDKKGKPTLQRLADIVENVGDKATADKIRSCRSLNNECTHCSYINFFIASTTSYTVSWWVIAISVLTLTITISLILLYTLQPHNGTIVMDRYASEIRDMYSKALAKYMDLSYSKYPAAGPYVPFIPLISIMVKGNRKKDADWLLNATVKEVLQNEETKKIPIEDILKQMTNQRLRLVLIEGEPGIGKSTLAKELVLRWAKQSDQLLNSHTMVIFIQLRFDTYNSATSIDDLFIDTGEVELKELILEVKKRKGAGVLWILDGFDELPYHLRNQSVFIQLIKGDVLPESTVLVTGRPVASKPLLEFLENDSKRISLRGFDSDKTLEYAKRYFNDGGIVSEFYSYYSGNLVIENMLYNPMNCYIVCTIFNDFITNNDKQYPRTMTELYNHYVRVLLKRHLIDVGMIDKHYNMPQYLINESSFNNSELQSVWNNFSILSEIAHNGVAEQKYIFGRELHHVTKLSMMNTIISFSVFDPDESSSFIHTTLQEYFAAVYVINNPDLESTYNFYVYTRNPSLKVVLTFYVGMLKMINRKLGNETLAALKHYISTLARQIRGDELYLGKTLLRCFYEHDSLIYNIGLPPMVYTNRCQSSIFDYYIIGYLVATHNITFAVRLTDPAQSKALNKGLQSHSTIQGNLKITLLPNKDTIPTILEDIINMPSHVPIIMFNFCPMARKHSLHNVEILLYHIISKFESLQKIIIDYILFNSTALGGPVLNLTQLNELKLMINCSHEDDLKLLKQLTAPGRPLRILILKCYKSYGSTDILNLIKHQSSLEELRIPSLAHNTRDSTATVWHKCNDSLTVSRYFSFMHPEFQSPVMNNQSVINSVMEIQLKSFTTIIKFYNHDLEKGLEVYINITIYSEPVKSELRSFINAYKRTLPLVEMIPIVRYYKIQLNTFMHAIINYKVRANP